MARDHYGSNAPVELGVAETIRALPGVIEVVPRVVGRTYVQGRFMAVLGLPLASLPASVRLVRGALPAGRGEVLLGERAAEHLGAEIGSGFSIQRHPIRDFKVAGVFLSAFNIWNADLLIMDFRDAAELFGLQGTATDLLVHTRPGYGQIVDVIVRLHEEGATQGQPPLRVQNRELIQRYSQRGFGVRAGVFAGFHCLAFALGIPALSVLSGIGLSERRREIGVLKALGWQTREVLLTVALESLLLGVFGFLLALILATFWVHLFNGAFLRQFFVPGFESMIPFRVPAEVFPVPFFLGLFLAGTLAMLGGVYPAWRTAVVPPAEALKS